MFRIVRNINLNGTVGGRSAADALRRRLPTGWTVEPRTGSDGNDLITLRSPDGRRAELTVVSRKRVLPRDIAHLVAQPEHSQGRLLKVPFLSPRARDLLAQANTSYMDDTGNLRVVVSDPAVFLEGRGADRDPQKQPRPLRSLKGTAAARVVRALCDFLPPYGVRTLADSSSTPLGTVSRVVTLLEEEALITRDEKKQITAVDWPTLIERWVADYSVTRSNVMRSYLEPRGLGAVVSKIVKLSRYAFTGSLAAQGAVAPARLAMIYVDDAERVARDLEFTPTEAGANVWLLEPFDTVVFERTQSLPFGPEPQTSIVAASPSQVVADLMTSPGRGPQEADALVERMKGTENAWRRKPRP